MHSSVIDIDQNYQSDPVGTIDDNMMSTNSNTLLLIANCGKGEEDSTSLKSCVACKMVKYCSRDCQKAHRSQHKQERRKRAAELHDEALFKQPPLNEECPICFLSLPSLETGKRYNSCCGKRICSGCVYAGSKMIGNVDQLCPFCRTAGPKTDEEILIRIKKRVEVGDAIAIHNLGCYYDEGRYGLPQDRDKALELWHRAAERDYGKAYCNIGTAYMSGNGVGRDKKKGDRYYELAAIGGDMYSRYNLGILEKRSGNIDRALKHFMIAVKSGHNESLNQMKQLYTHGYATKDDYAKALQAYQTYLSEIKSDQRDEAAASDDENKYYE